MFDYDLVSQEAVRKLDQYDLTSFLSQIHGSNVYDVLERLEQLCNIHMLPKYIDEALDELSTDEFVEYLCERYGMGLTEAVQQFVWWGKDCKFHKEREKENGTREVQPEDNR